MLPALALVGVLLSVGQANGDQNSKTAQPTDATVTCEVKNPDRAANPVQFSAEGVDLTEWLKRFSGWVRGNWFVPFRYLTVNGCAIVSFKVAKDGGILDVVLKHPSETPAYNVAARNAILGSNPTAPLPDEYRGEPIPFTFTFFYDPPPAADPAK